MAFDAPAIGNRPTLGITMGDPGGIGAEVIVKALTDESLRARAKFIIYGLHEQIAYAADRAELTPYWFRKPWESVTKIESGVVVADFDEIAVSADPPHRPTAESGSASMQFLESAIKDARSGKIDAIVTGPIHKTAWDMAGIPFPGHTELLAKRFKSRRVTMMFVGGPFRVALASIHEALFELRNSFTIGSVFQPIDLLHQALQNWFGIEAPRIAVAGLNPHAGENGRFGDEESRIIEPAIVMARDAGIDAGGPYPADTVFRSAAHGEFDGVVAMYHDQGLIPVKLLAFDEAVNVTLGLPVIRTSVDHGTAFDIAGKNRADSGSMKAAIRLAIDLAANDARHCSAAPATTLSLDGPRR
ncbi:MAG: 4-hydroxythreonine-4-phosphate dehydrogenase PdxA [Planctomycetota bacterium]|nr:4-hydroxythreonine-4-phosphate dehydrogenase PdxA [Planctomycetota bacterium]MCZ6817220.1 4-hydroxythreonine-4-phosphate dehydrogenase PdxA [Planctomycetota bacterium]